MEEGLVAQAVILAILLFFSAYFSGTEAAFFSLSSLEQDTLKRRSPLFLRKIMEMILSAPDDILITILTGNMFVNIIASTVAGLLGDRLFAFDSELFSIIGMTLLLLLIGEMTPKNLGVRNSLAFAGVSALPLYYIHIFLKPLRWVLNLSPGLINRLFPLEVADARAVKRRVILSAVQIGFKEGILDQSELNLFETFFHFRSKSAGEVMIPRTQITGIEVSNRISRLIHDSETLKMAGKNSLIPIFKRDMDHLLGYINRKDLLAFQFGLKTGESLRKIMKPFLSVPESKNCAELMVDMKETNTEMALVVDEYGGTAGIITFQSLLEELFEYFYPEAFEQVSKIGENRYLVPGNLDIDSLRALYQEDLPTENRTVAGLITQQLEEIPAAGTKLIIGRLEFIVKQITRNRILKIEVRRLG